MVPNGSHKGSAMKYRSVFDIIGPVMVGPSSSHTAGAVRLGLLARRLFGRAPERADIYLYGSFAHTYRGHATDVALLAGVLGMDTDNPDIPRAFALAQTSGLAYAFHPEAAVPDHPNTARIVLTAEDARITVTGVSLGGGLVQLTRVDGFELRLSGENPALLIFHEDAAGTIAAATQMLASQNINISHMEVSRTEKGHEALMVIETDQPVPKDITDHILTQKHIRKIVRLG